MFGKSERRIEDGVATRNEDPRLNGVEIFRE
jgi:hypothetical protein